MEFGFFGCLADLDFVSCKPARSGCGGDCGMKRKIVATWAQGQWWAMMCYMWTRFKKLAAPRTLSNLTWIYLELYFKALTFGWQLKFSAPKSFCIAAQDLVIVRYLASLVCFASLLLLAMSWEQFQQREEHEVVLHSLWTDWYLIGEPTGYHWQKGNLDSHQIVELSFTGQLGLICIGFKISCDTSIGDVGAEAIVCNQQFNIFASPCLWILHGQQATACDDLASALNKHDALSTLKWVQTEVFTSAVHQNNMRAANMNVQQVSKAFYVAFVSRFEPTMFKFQHKCACPRF